MTTLKHHLAAQECEWNTIPPHAHIWRTCTFLSEIEACLHSRSYAPYPTTLPILHICPLDTFIGEPLTYYLPWTKLMSISIVFQVENLPTTGTAVMAVLINWLPPTHYLSRLLAEIQACLQPDPFVPYPVILWTQHLIPEHSNWNHCPVTFCWHQSHATDPRWQSTNNFNSFGNNSHPTTEPTNSVIGGWGQHPTSARWPTPGEGSHHDSITLAYSCHHQHPSTSDGIVCVVHLGPQLQHPYFYKFQPSQHESEI